MGVSIATGVSALSFQDIQNELKKSFPYNLYQLSSSVTQSGLTEKIMAQIAIPASFLKDGDRLNLKYTLQSSGVTDTFTGIIRFGTLGTTADTLISSGTLISAATDACGGETELKRISSTSIQKMGNGSFAGGYGGGSSSNVASPVTVSNLDTNLMYLSFNVNSNATNDTVTLQDLYIEYIPKT